MARLIDADVFKTEYENLITWVSHRAEKARLREFIKDIQNQPTVKAISIEWIKNYARHKASKGFTEIDCYWQSWEDDVLKMVTAWEKENERNDL